MHNQLLDPTPGSMVAQRGKVRVGAAQQNRYAKNG